MEREDRKALLIDLAHAGGAASEWASKELAEMEKEDRIKLLTELAHSGGAASEWASRELANMDRPISTDPLGRRMYGIKDVPLEGNWYLDIDNALRVLNKMKAEIELNGNLELYLTDEIPIEYYQAIQRSSFVKITGEWDQFALNGIENMQAKYNVERTDNGVVDLATIEALIKNAADKKEYYDDHPTIEKIEKVVGDFFSGGVGDMVEYFGLSFIAPKVIDEVKPNNVKPEVKSGEETGEGAWYAKKPLNPSDFVGTFDESFAGLGNMKKVELAFKEIENAFGKKYADEIKKLYESTNRGFTQTGDTLGMFKFNSKGEPILDLNKNFGNAKMMANTILHEVKHLRQSIKLGSKEFMALPVEQAEIYATSTNIWQGKRLGLSFEDLQWFQQYYDFFRGQ